MVVLCEEPRPAYDRVQLTSYFSGHAPRTNSSLAETGLHGTGTASSCTSATRPSAVDREARTVTARSGLTVAYDTLVLATGSYPFVPPVPGKDADGLLRLPHHRGPARDRGVREERATHRCGGRRRAARAGGGGRAARGSDSTRTSWSSRRG